MRTTTMRKYWYLLIFPFLALVYFNVALVPGNTLFGTDYLGGGAYDGRKFVQDYIHSHGEFPMWNPYTNSSMVNNTTGDLLYPISVILYQFLPVQSVQVWSYFIHICLAGIFFYLFALRIGSKRWGAVFGGVAYMFTGQIVSLIYAGQDGKIIVSCLLPALLYFTDVYFDKQEWRWFIPISVVFAFMLLSSHVQMSFYSILIGGIYAVKKAINNKWWIGLVITLIIPIAGLCLAGVEYVPFLHHIPQSERFGGQWSTANTQSWSMPPSETIGLAFPKVFGLLENYHGENQFKLHTEYLGLIVCVFAIVGVFKYSKWFWLGLAVIGCLVSWGTHTPFGNLILIIPLYSKFRAVGMAFFVVSFAFCMLASFGFGVIKKVWLSVGLCILSFIDLWIIDKLFFHVVQPFDLWRYGSAEYATPLQFTNPYNKWFWFGSLLSLATSAILTLIFFWSKRSPDDSDCS